jgi:hypothetical protein
VAVAATFSRPVPRTGPQATSRCPTTRKLLLDAQRFDIRETLSVEANRTRVRAGERMLHSTSVAPETMFDLAVARVYQLRYLLLQKS